jgi:hypothetical protein
MKTKLTALTAVLALSLSMPAMSVADRGGVPHSSKPCPSKAGKGKGKGHKKHPARNSRGKKCGHQARA